jgi:hypothetical protein
MRILMVEFLMKKPEIILKHEDKCIAWKNSFMQEIKSSGNCSLE